MVPTTLPVRSNQFSCVGNPRAPRPVRYATVRSDTETPRSAHPAARLLNLFRDRHRIATDRQAPHEEGLRHQRRVTQEEQVAIGVHRVRFGALQHQRAIRGIERGSVNRRLPNAAAAGVEYSTWRPSGRNVGYASVEPSRRPLTAVERRGAAAGRRDAQSWPALLNTITSSVFHVPPAACLASQIVATSRSSLLSASAVRPRRNRATARRATRTAASRLRFPSTERHRASSAPDPQATDAVGGHGCKRKTAAVGEILRVESVWTTVAGCWTFSLTVRSSSAAGRRAYNARGHGNRHNRRARRASQPAPGAPTWTLVRPQAR